MALNGTTWTDWITFNGEPDTFIEAHFEMDTVHDYPYLTAVFNGDGERVVPDPSTLSDIMERLTIELEAERRENEISSHDKDPVTGEYY